MKPLKKCPTSCSCLCHDMNGGGMHPGKICPGKIPVVKEPVVWVNEATPMSGPEVKLLLEENESLRKANKELICKFNLLRRKL